jgi:hypothetical protein
MRLASRLRGMRDSFGQLARIGVLRSVDDTGCRALLYDLARLHHDHSVAEQADDVEVVTDQEVTHTELRLEIRMKEWARWRSATKKQLMPKETRPSIR